MLFRTSLLILVLLAGMPACGGTTEGDGAVGGQAGATSNLPKAEQCDDLCDGTVDLCLAYTYDGAGNVLTRQVDDYCDGAIDECDTWTYDDANRVLTEQQAKHCEGPADFCVTLSYSNDRVGSARGDSDCDGTVELCDSEKFDDQGRLASYERDNNCDGSNEFCVTYTYSASGELTNDRGDTNCTGTPDSCYDYTYERRADGLVTKRTMTACDGGVVWCCTSLYD